MMSMDEEGVQFFFLIFVIDFAIRVLNLFHHIPDQIARFAIFHQWSLRKMTKVEEQLLFTTNLFLVIWLLGR